MRIVCLTLLDAKVNMSMVQAGIPNLKGILSEKNWVGSTGQDRVKYYTVRGWR